MFFQKKEVRKTQEERGEGGEEDGVSCDCSV